MIGDRAVQSNYFITEIRRDGCLVVLADGTIDSVNGMRAAVLCCDTVKTSFPGGWIPESLFLQCQSRISDFIYTGRMPRVSLTAVWTDKKQIFYRQVGSQRLFFWHRGILAPLREKEGVAGLEPGSGMILCSRGVFTAINEVEIGAVMMEKSLSAYEKSQEMLLRVRRKNKREQENATIIILEHSKSGQEKPV